MNAASLIDLLDRLTVLRRSETRTSGAALELPTVQVDVLRYLSEANAYSDTPVTVAAYLATTRGTISQTIRSLERKGMLVKRQDRHDGRVKHCVLTEKGRAALARADEQSVLAGVLDQLAPGDRANVARVLESIVGDTYDRAAMARFGRCGACRLLQQGERGPRCGETLDWLAPSDLELKCRMFEPEAATRVAEVA